MNRAEILKRVAKRPKRQAETGLQAGIIAYLKTRGDWWGWRQNSGVFRVAKRVIRAGIPGVNDILGVHAPAGLFTGFEVKVPGEELSPRQEDFAEMVRMCGGRSYKVKSIADVAQALGPPTVRIAGLEWW